MDSKNGMTVKRLFTKKGKSPYDAIEYNKKISRIKDADGSIVFEMKDVEVPKGWSQVATDILAQKYFRKAGVPQYDENGKQLIDENGKPVLGSERSIKQVIHRLAGCWRHWGEKHGYFKTKEDADAYYDEMSHMLLNQMGAPNSPQWFNTGLHWAYDIQGPSQGHYYVDPKTGKAKASEDAYTHPQPHACFILAVNDDLVNKGGIMDLWVREARLFKYGSGTGTNFSQLRGAGEQLSGGGASSGLMSWLKIGDRAAGAIKSGGTTRRAAKMVCLDMDHPDIENFITWKVKEEDKVAALIKDGYDSTYEGEAYQTVSGQNSNNSVRVPNAFIDAVKSDGVWELTSRTTKEVMKKVSARDLWDKISYSAWRCADPGVQYDSIINDWHTCPASGKINASNPCSEYMFLDNTACNLASINLMTFFDKKTCKFDIDGYMHAIRIWTITLEISVLMAQFPSEEIAQMSYDFRTLGLGYANLGTMLMVSGIPYDSDKGRAIAGAMSAIMTGESYATSAELAQALNPFPKYKENKDSMLRVIRNHRRAAYDAPRDEYDELSIKPIAIDQELCPKDILDASHKAWDRALKLGEKYGYRNAQTTVIAPTGTIGLLMDCDTTGVEPDFALVKFKKLAGGGYFKIANQAVEPALHNLGYSPQEINEILRYAVGANSLEGTPHVNRKNLVAKGMTDEELDRIEEMLPGVFDIRFVFNVGTLGQSTLQRIGISKKKMEAPDFDFLLELGFTESEINAANQYICGTMTLEGAPHLKEEHYKVFDCANRCGTTGKRFIHYMGHIKMMAAVQPFISGAISKTINMTNEVTIEDIEEAYMESWKLGLKAVALYRDGSKLSQPLSTRSSDKNATKEMAEAQEIAATTGDTMPLLHGQKKHLPHKRAGITVEAMIDGHKIFMRTGEYEDGHLGEVFVDMHKEGAAYRSVMNCFAIAVSIGLQYGVPLEKYVKSFTFTRFEPRGMTDHPNVQSCTSVLDFVFRVLGMEYLNRTDLVHVKPDWAAEMQMASPVSRVISEQGMSPIVSLQNDALKKAELTSLSSEDDVTPLATGGTLSSYTENMMGDAPACSTCGHITVRNGACYKCLNCGNSEGCS